MPINLKDWPILRNSRLFAQLDDETFKDIIETPRTKRFAKGERLFPRGEPARSLLLVLEGWVRLLPAQKRLGRVQQYERNHGLEQDQAYPRWRRWGLCPLHPHKHRISASIIWLGSI